LSATLNILNNISTKKIQYNSLGYRWAKTKQQKIYMKKHTLKYTIKFMK